MKYGDKIEVLVGFFIGLKGYVTDRSPDGYTAMLTVDTDGNKKEVLLDRGEFILSPDVKDPKKP